MAKLTLVPTVGFDGNYRQGTLVPIAVEITNTGDTLNGEFRIVADNTNALRDRYRFQGTIPRGAHKLQFFYVVLEDYTKTIAVQFWQNGQMVSEGRFRRCSAIDDWDRLLVVVGGTGSSFNYLHGTAISAREQVMPRPWDFTGIQQYQMRASYGGGGSGGTTGQVQVVYVSSDLLPPNPEAYASASVVALMSDVTENTLKLGREGLPQWVHNGGHLLVAGGGVSSRLDAPFFRGLLPPRTGGLPTWGERLTVPECGTAVTLTRGAGRVTQLTFDPDQRLPRDWPKASAFIGKNLVGREPRAPLTFALRDAFANATMVRNLRPPDLRIIIGFLLVYLVMLVPVNYFVLKKIDKRELAWITTPAIVLVFTLGAYGIGYLTKGNRLVLNTFSLVETSVGQRSATAISQLLIFSPARTNYQIDCGTTALLAREIDYKAQEYYEQERKTPALNISQEKGHLILNNVGVNMWDFRQFTMAHQLELDGGFSASVADAGISAPVRVKGRIINRTVYDYPLCELYINGAFVKSFAIPAGDTVTVEKVPALTTARMNEDAVYMLEQVKSGLHNQFNAGQPLAQGIVLVGYTDDIHLPVQIDRHAPSTAVTAVVVHLN